MKNTTLLNDVVDCICTKLVLLLMPTCSVGMGGWGGASEVSVCRCVHRIISPVQVARQTDHLVTEMYVHMCIGSDGVTLSCWSSDRSCAFVACGVLIRMIPCCRLLLD